MADFSEKIKKLLAEDLINTTEAIKSEVKGVAKKTAETLKSTSPKRRGKYAKSWTVSKTEGKFEISAIVHNATSYRLTHLLEKGHQNKDGSRTRAQVHIAPAEEMAIKELEARVIQKLSK